MSRELLSQKASHLYNYYMSHSHQPRDSLEWVGVRIFSDTDFFCSLNNKTSGLYTLFHLSSKAKVVLRQVLCAQQLIKSYVQQIPKGKQQEE